MEEEEEGESCCPAPQRLWLCFPFVSPTAFIVACANIAAQMNYLSATLSLMMLEKTASGPPKWAASATTSVVFLGSIVGQLSLGVFGDRVGRGAGLAIALTFMALGAAASATALMLFESTALVYGFLAVARFLTGFGAGGAYPLSATAAYEADGDGGTAAALVRASWALFWQVPGQIFVYVVAGALSLVPNLSWTWKARIVLASGALPALAALSRRSRRSPRRRASLSRSNDKKGGQKLTSLFPPRRRRRRRQELLSICRARLCDDD